MSDVTLQTYASLALRTDIPDYTGAISRATGEIRALHGALGIATEVLELEVEIDACVHGPAAALEGNLLAATKEMGDICWFSAIIADHFGFDLGDIFQEAGNHAASALACDLDSSSIYACSTIAAALRRVKSGAEAVDTQVKACVFYGKPYTQATVRGGLLDIFFGLMRLTDMVITGRQFRDVLQVNIDKLRTRYPAKFTEAAAIARADEAKA